MEPSVYARCVEFYDFMAITGLVWYQVFQFCSNEMTFMLQNLPATSKL